MAACISWFPPDRRVLVNRLVLVTGSPASGKTTLAVPLAERLIFPLMRKDAVKETLDDAINPPMRDPAWSQLLSATTYEVMWTIAPYFDDLVLEANFYPNSHGHRRRLLKLHSRPVEVYCSCPPEVALERYRGRATERHPVHLEVELDLDRYRDWNEPIGVGPVIVADTTRPVNLDLITAQVRQALESGSSE